MVDDTIYILGDQKDDPQDISSRQNGSVSKNSTEVLNVLKNALNRNASDIHFQVGSHPIFRIDGVLSPFMPAKPVTDAFMADCTDLFLNERQKKCLYENRQLDCSATLPNFTHRFRINFFFQRNHLSGSFRANPIIPPTIAQLGLPSLMENLAALPHGLVLITGATGCGKSTTLAALVDYMNHHRNAHIITISDPIEYIHTNKRSLISQREIGSDATSFADALRVALREDPNVLVIEEIRDLESISMALTAAETGHLVFATLHTNDAIQAIDRIIDIFPPHQQHQIRSQVAMTLRAVVSQVLLKKKGAPGRIAVFETMP
ncbi:MAG: PilT/PilU family type 4a pilus ATPase, partial [Candidatus Omnitrophica bacterium]|nr:PilT/PilU family type 4a pilus ATPase [Candidatus Omnitrophota bacterium]